MSVNKVIIVGRLGQDPEIKFTPTGAVVCNFSVATSETWVDKAGQKQEKTEWHRIVVWGKIAESCKEFLAKGSQVYIEGALQTRSWDDQTGQKKYITEINARSVQFLSRANTGANIGANTGFSSTSNAGTSDHMSSSHMSSAMNQDTGIASFTGTQEYHISNDASFTADDIPF